MYNTLCTHQMVFRMILHTSTSPFQCKRSLEAYSFTGRIEEMNKRKGQAMSREVVTGVPTPTEQTFTCLQGVNWTIRTMFFPISYTLVFLYPLVRTHVEESQTNSVRSPVRLQVQLFVKLKTTWDLATQTLPSTTVLWVYTSSFVYIYYTPCQESTRPNGVTISISYVSILIIYKYMQL